jgi:hypothetical protein
MGTELLGHYPVNMKINGVRNDVHDLIKLP